MISIFYYIVRKFSSDKSQDKSVDVYNASNNKVNNVSNRELMSLGLDLCWDVPLNDTLWYPSVTMTSCRYNYYLQVLFRHVLPALFVDGILKFLNKKPMYIFNLIII